MKQEKQKKQEKDSFDKLKDLKKEHKDHKKEDKKEEKKDNQDDKINELTESLQRLQAEFENYKKRIEREKSELVKYSNSGLIEKILPIIDTFELALKNSKDHENFVKGVEMIYAQLNSILKSEGLHPITALGEKFDPFRHDVLLKVDSDEDDDIVLEEIQKGYMLNEKVLRHTKVKVSKKKCADDNKKDSAKKDT